MTVPFQDQQLQFMIELAEYRTAYLNPLFHLLHYVDSMYFVFLLVPFIWVGFSHKWGIRLFYAFLISMLINTLCKNYFGWSRPCTDLEGIGLYSLTSFGFPSCGAQNAMLLGGMIAYYWKSRYAIFCGAAYMLLISFSRLYLGVHYPVDVLGGWFIGLVLLVIFIKTVDPIERFFKEKELWVSLLIGELIPLAMLVGTAKVTFHRYDAIAVGLGVYLSSKYGLYLPASKKIYVSIARGLIAVTGVFGLFFALKDTPVFLSYGVISLWLSLFASPVCKWILHLTKFRKA